MPQHRFAVALLGLLALSGAADAAARDRVSPRPPTWLTTKAQSTTALTVSWGGARDNGKRIAAYGVYQDGVRILETIRTTVRLDKLRCDRSYRIAIDSVDPAGNRSARTSMSARARLCTPSGLAVATAATTALTLTWDPPRRFEDVAAYGLYRDGALVGTVTEPVATFRNLAPTTLYRLEVDKVDSRGSRSARSGLEARTAPDTIPPSRPAPALAGVTEDSLRLTWAAAGDDVGVTGYGIYLDGTLTATATGTEATISNLLCGRAHAVGVDATDAAGNRSPAGELRAVTWPCAPRALSVVSASATRLTVRWSPRRGDEDAVSYGLYRGGVLVGTTTEPEGTFTGLAPKTRYRLEVDTVDSRGNRSRRTAIETETAADSTKPGPPGSLGASPTDEGISLAWGSADDDVGVERYAVYRAGALVGETASTSFAVGPLACGTQHTFEVEAVDGAGNRSTRAAVSASTRACPADLFLSPSGSDGTWSHVATTYDGSRLRVYVNGEQVSELAASGPIAASTSPLRLGGNSVWGEWFSGLIDDARVYDRALSAVELREDMARPVGAAPRAGLVAAYALDGTAADASGNGNDGVVSGATWSTAGRHGGALSFDGVDDLVTVAHSPSLALTSAMTLEAWVHPNVPPGQWRTVLMKERPGHLAFALMSSTDTGAPSGHVFIGSDVYTRPAGPLPMNSCARAAPCVTLDHAYRTASPGHVVELAGGTYPSQEIRIHAAKTSPDDVVFRPAAGADVRVGGLTIYGGHLELRDLRVDGWWARSVTDLTVRRVDTKHLFVDSSTDVSVLGGSVGPTLDYDSQIRPAGVGAPPSRNVLVDGVRFHDATLSPGSTAHVECLQIWASEQIVVRNSTFSNCAHTDVFIDAEWLGTLRDITLENNVGDLVRSGFYSFRAGANGGCENVVFRNNSAATAMFIVCEGGWGSGNRFVGNVSPYSQHHCRSYVTYSFNVWEGAACGADDLNAPSSFVDVDAFDLRLRAGAAAIGRGNPADYPATDIAGVTRPVGGAPDAGAYER